KVGEERVLAERNRRDQLIGASERAAAAEHAAHVAVEAAAAGVAEAEASRERAIGAHRAAVESCDEAAEQHRRLEAAIDRRRQAPDDGPGLDRRARIRAQLSAEQGQLERAQRERHQRQSRIREIEAEIARAEPMVAVMDALLEALADAAEAIAVCLAGFEAELSRDREAGELVAAQLRTCAQEEASIQLRLHAAGEALTTAEVSSQRARDQETEAVQALTALAQQLGLEPEAAVEALAEERRQELRARLERLARRREQLGPVNPLAQEQYAEAVAHVELLESQRHDLEAALRELAGLIRDTDRQIRETFEQTFALAARNFEELAARVFPGGGGQLRLVAETDPRAPVIGAQPGSVLGAGDGGPGAEPGIEPDGAEEASDGEELLGIEIEITRAGKPMKRLSLLSGGEKAMTALAFLFAVFLARPCPFYIMDEVEAALDDINISRFLDLLDTYSDRAQFIVVTHQKRTMEAADSLYGVSMGADGISKVVSRRLPVREVAA
ncbi:MAG: hypothetical protein M0T77_13075, partial [Actinomycetota bacterium]|nr:hypothetical protein [Actinomycetota bacterium]